MCEKVKVLLIVLFLLDFFAIHPNHKKNHSQFKFKKRNKNKCNSTASAY